MQLMKKFRMSIYILYYMFLLSFAQALSRTWLSTLSKKRGGIDSIAVGEILRMLIASETVDLFKQLQLGVQVKDGEQAIIHSTKL